MDISIIIVSYNVKNFLRLCLESVLISLQGTHSEIIVVDNNSIDGTADMVREHYRGIRLISNARNQGFAVACNQGINDSSGRYVLILNPDTVVQADTITKCMVFMEEHDEAGALGPRLIGRDGRFLPESKRGIPFPAAAFFRFTHLYRLFPGSATVNRYYMGHIAEDETSAVDAVTGAFLFMRREALEKAGLFDERYFMFGEDIDLCIQIRLAGYSVYYYPGVTITHFKGRSGAMSSYRGLGHFYRSMHLFIEKNLSSRYIFPVRALLHVGVAGVALVSFILRTPSVLIRKFL